MTINLNAIGTYSTGIFDQSGAEIPAYDSLTQRLFVVNAQAVAVEVLDISDPSNPTKIGEIDASAFGGVANSVSVKNGIIAVAIEANEKTDLGKVLFFNTNSDFSEPLTPLNSVPVGALPDMLTFTPDGTKVIVANEGEPNNDYTIDPQGSVSIIDISNGIEQATVTSANFNSFDSQKETLMADGVRIFGPNASVSQDLEPEYITISSDSKTAYVTLQENNALAVVDLETNIVTSILPLGFKDYNTQPTLETSFFNEADLPVLGTTQARGEILLGGFSGLYFEGINPDNGNLQFITHPDIGPSVTSNKDIDGDGVTERVRTYLLPDLQPRLVRFEYNPSNGNLSVVEQIFLTRPDGSALTGLPNLSSDDGARIPIDEDGNILEFDPLGADLEGIVKAEDGTYWMADEYRPSIYHFQADGTLIARYVPEGLPPEVGTPAFPEIYNNRVANRGFEAIAYQNGKVYAFIQSPLDNPTSSDSATIRILEFDPITETTVGEYLYIQEDMGGGSDKIGDAVAVSKLGEFLVTERDSSTGIDSKKVVFRINLAGATNLQTLPDNTLGDGQTFESLTLEQLNQKGIKPVTKEVHADLAALGYTFTDKPEGLTLINDTTIAVINDNDFGEVGTPIGLGIINLNNALDASDRDSAINIRNWPILGMYQPDAIASYQVNGETYLVTANEGDTRDYSGFSEIKRIKDLTLDPTAFPNATELKKDPNLGRLNVTKTLGDSDGDGDYDQLYSFGGRSFSIWNSDGELVFDSGSQIEQIIAQELPDFFNSNHTSNESFDTRSDDKGPEPEGVAIGVIEGQTYAFIGLERVGGVMVYNVSNPTNPEFIQYVNNRNFVDENGDVIPTDINDVTNPAAGDLGPEGLVFISAENSPNGKPLLAVANEVSGTTTIFEVEVPGTSSQPAQVKGLAGYTVDPIFTIGETFNDYTPPGILDGIGAYALDDNTVRVFVNHEIGNNVGYAYTLSSGVSLTGARVSYFDIDKNSLQVLDVGLAYNKIYNRAGLEVTVTNPLDTIEGQFGLDRFCSANLFSAGQYGLMDTIFFTGEETDGGTEFALNAETKELWALPWLGAAAWESVTALDTGTPDKIALLVGDDRQTAPLLLYVGTKGIDYNSDGSIDFLERNGLTGGDLFVWVADDPTNATDAIELDPRQFKGTGNSTKGKFVEIDIYDETGTLPGYDDLGFATQVTQDALVDAVTAFSFSRPEDVDTNPNDGTQAVLASTGRTGVFDNVDTWGTTYVVDLDFAGIATNNITADLKIIYSGDDAGGGVFAGPDYGLRSPDNLDWADDGKIYLQEDRAISSSLFGATSGEEASIWRIDPSAPNPAATMTRIGQIDRTGVPSGQTDSAPTDIGNWETSGILDVSSLFDKEGGSLFIFDVQAHSLFDGEIMNVPGIDTDGDGTVEANDNLVQGGQLAFLVAPINSPLQVSLTSSPAVVPEGEQLTWDFDLSNPVPQGGLVIHLDLTEDTDPLPGDIQYNVAGSENITNFQLVTVNGVIQGANITLTEGATEAKLVSNVIADNLTEGNESVTFTLVDGEGYNANPNSNEASFTIEDTSVNSSLEVSLTSSPAVVQEGGQLTWDFELSNPVPQGGLVIHLDLTEDTDPLPGDIQYNVAGSENITNFQLVTVNGVIQGANITLTEGATEAKLVSNVIADNLTEGEESVTFTLVDGEGYNANPESNEASFTIEDTSVNASLQVSLTSSPAVVQEGGQLTWDFELSNPVPQGGLVIHLDLTEDTDPLPGDIQYNVAGSENITNFQLVTLNGVIQGANITLTEGATEAKLVSNVIADNLTEGEESVTFTLVDGEGYNANPESNEASFTIEDTSVTPVTPPPKLVNGTAGDDYFDSAFPDAKKFVGEEQTLFTGSGDDYVDVSQTGQGNRIDTGSGDDMVFAGTNNRIILGAGDDILFAGSGNGGNMITGGAGADQFWLITDQDEIPAVRNKINDFKSEDVIGFMNTDLSLANKGSMWNYAQNGDNVIISAFGQEIAQLLKTTISDANFVFA